MNWRRVVSRCTNRSVTRSFIQDSDRPEVAQFIEKHWGSRKMMSCGKVYDADDLEGIIERDQAEMVALLTMRVDTDGLEILSVNSVVAGRRIGTSLILAAIEEARKRACVKVWLATTNDNLRAVALYQRLGFRITEVHVGMVDEARKIKPEIPRVGADGIPVHDELILELQIEP